MKMGVSTITGRGRNLLLPLLAILLLAGCHTCPIDSCHARKVHMHNGVKYRARPLWKLQNPAIGERVKWKNQGKNKRKDSDHSHSL